MSKIAVRRCHQKTGADGCASDIVNEIEVAEAYYKYAMEGLRSLGHEVLDVTPPEAHRGLSDSLMYGVNKANNWGADIFISCHANDFKRTDAPMGCEVVYFGNSSKGHTLATNINKKITDLGFKDRGAKADVRGLCELRNTSSVAVIIEPFFVCSHEDVRVWNNVGAKRLGYAIAEGICGKSIDGNIPSEDNSNQGGTNTSSNEDYSCKGKQGTVTGNDVRLRDGASTNSNILGHANKGDKFEIGYKLGDWYSIYWGEHGAFISASYLSISSSNVSKPIQSQPSLSGSYEQHGNATILVDKLMIRTSPSVSASSVGSYSKGETIYNYDRVYNADGYRWIRYVGGSGNYRYVAVRRLSDNKKYANCY